jgi:hypothetical protein
MHWLLCLLLFCYISVLRKQDMGSVDHMCLLVFCQVLLDLSYVLAKSLPGVVAKLRYVLIPE